jgi:hypothetical protein
VDLDGLENAGFWKDYWDNRRVGTALYFLPHLETMPERSVAALTAIVTAPLGGVLFHCMGGRDRTGMISLLLLAAVNVEADEIVDDYLETVRRGDLRAASANRNNAEPELEAVCQLHGTTTEGASRAVVAGVEIDRVLSVGGTPFEASNALATWRSHLKR